MSHLNCSCVAEIISVSHPTLSDFPINHPKYPLEGFGKVCLVLNHKSLHLTSLCMENSQGESTTYLA